MATPESKPKRIRGILEMLQEQVPDAERPDDEMPGTDEDIAERPASISGSAEVRKRKKPAPVV